MDSWHVIVWFTADVKGHGMTLMKTKPIQVYKNENHL